MRFFVPNANDPRHSEELYQTIRGRLVTVSGGVSERRIYRLKFQHEEQPSTAAVGSDSHALGRGAVLAIFEGANGDFYVCTQRQSPYDTEWHPVGQSTVLEAEEFSALA